MVSNRRTDTGPERRLRSALHRMGLRFRKDHRVDVGGRPIRSDIVFPRLRLCVFVDGCFWHQCPEHATHPKRNAGYWAPKLAANVERDRRVDAALAAAGWHVLRVWEHEDGASAAERVARAVHELSRLA